MSIGLDFIIVHLLVVCFLGYYTVSLNSKQSSENLVFLFSRSSDLINLKMVNYIKRMPKK